MNRNTGGQESQNTSEGLQQIISHAAFQITDDSQVKDSEALEAAIILLEMSRNFKRDAMAHNLPTVPPTSEPPNETAITIESPKLRAALDCGAACSSRGGRTFNWAATYTQYQPSRQFSWRCSLCRSFFESPGLLKHHRKRSATEGGCRLNLVSSLKDSDASVSWHA